MVYLIMQSREILLIDEAEDKTYEKISGSDANPD